MKHIFIINLKSGNLPQKLEIFYKIEAICKNYQLDYKIYSTKTIAEANQICNSYRNVKAIIYSVGGDGTLNNIVNHIDFEKNILQIIPCGSGNDTFKSIDVKSKSLEESILKGQESLIDLGSVNGNIYFINIASLGIDAQIAQNLELFRNKKQLNSKQKYLCSIGYTLIKGKSISLKSSFENDYFPKTLITICNGRFYGNGIEISPNSILNDGLFNIVVAEKTSRLDLIYLLSQVKKLKHLKSSKVFEIITSNFVVESLEPTICNIDGEIITDSKFSFDCHPKILRLRK